MASKSSKNFGIRYDPCGNPELWDMANVREISGVQQEAKHDTGNQRWWANPIVQWTRPNRKIIERNGEAPLLPVWLPEGQRVCQISHRNDDKPMRSSNFESLMIFTYLDRTITRLWLCEWNYVDVCTWLITHPLYYYISIYIWYGHPVPQNLPPFNWFDK